MRHRSVASGQRALSSSTREPPRAATSRPRGLDATAELLQVMEVRACIEPSVTARAAARVTPADIVQLHALLEAMRREPSRQSAEAQRRRNAG
ncbi:FCD domain-containing protein [Streptomyces sp. ME19-01-6]|uniref:FCD domain-containing protein n=1 Tax=Streptomyces sp. ME19-01-6 TaxID=3028686 RepID=UPI0029A2A023|nr:FCD domain-containing protein [Streptomyces sp. ME19-01-6]MDX3229278.1 FCD domain-containing protein [Streptomyces sp. ME19-01-6]